MQGVIDRFLGLVEMNNRLAQESEGDKTVGIIPEHGVGLGEKHHLRFVGIFPGTGTQETIVRPVHIIFSSPEVVVCADRQTSFLYVVDMRIKLSLGCRMTAEFHKPEEVAATPFPTRPGALIQEVEGPRIQ